MKYPVFLFILLVACQEGPKRPPYHSVGSETLDFEAFTIKAPGWRKFELQGIDSYVGGLTNGKDSLTFDYGWYSQHIEINNCSGCLYGVDTINGLTAVLKIPQTDGDGEIAMAIDHVGGDNRFYIDGKNIPGTKEILAMLRTIYFRSRHDTVNRFLALSQFKPYLRMRQHQSDGSLVGTGKQFFYENCASCHSRFKTLIGPPLSDATITSKTPDWMYHFLTHKAGRMKDTVYKAFAKEYGIECIQLKAPDRGSIEALMAYLKQPATIGY
jgi:hypothetical protein